MSDTQQLLAECFQPLAWASRTAGRLPGCGVPVLSYVVAAGEEEYTLPAMLPVMVGTPGGTRWAGPALGQHTSEILAGLGIDPEEVDKLRDAKVI